MREVPLRKKSDAEQLQKSVSRIPGAMHAKSGDSRTWSTFLQLLRVKSRAGKADLEEEFETARRRRIFRKVNHRRVLVRQVPLEMVPTDPAQGYLTHKKLFRPRTLQQAHAQVTMVVLKFIMSEVPLNHCRALCRQVPLESVSTDPAMKNVALAPCIRPKMSGHEPAGICRRCNSREPCFTHPVPGLKVDHCRALCRQVPLESVPTDSAMENVASSSYTCILDDI
jgi:hypothetical protein